jgi:hypothetical protein
MVVVPRKGPLAVKVMGEGMGTILSVWQAEFEQRVFDSGAALWQGARHMSRAVPGLVDSAKGLLNNGEGRMGYEAHLLEVRHPLL